jgi:hypothetical protein
MNMILRVLGLVFLCSYSLCAQTDCIIFSFDRPLQLYALLESIEKNVHDLNDVFVIYRTTEKKYGAAYDEVFKTFNFAIPVQQTARANDFKEKVRYCFYTGRSEYIVFAVDDIIITAPIFLDDCIRCLREAQGYAFYLRLGKNLNYCYALNKQQAHPKFMVNADYLVWRLDRGVGDWIYSHTVDMAVYKKSMISGYIDMLSYSNPNTFEGQWAARHAPAHAMGVCYPHSKMINIPLNRVQDAYKNRHMDFATKEELLALFNAGKKIDIFSLQGIENNACHFDIEPQFIDR